MKLFFRGRMPDCCRDMNSGEWCVESSIRYHNTLNEQQTVFPGPNEISKNSRSLGDDWRNIKWQHLVVQFTLLISTRAGLGDTGGEHATASLYSFHCICLEFVYLFIHLISTDIFVFLEFNVPTFAYHRLIKQQRTCNFVIPRENPRLKKLLASTR